MQSDLSKLIIGASRVNELVENMVKAIDDKKWDLQPTQRTLKLHQELLQAIDILAKIRKILDYAIPDEDKVKLVMPYMLTITRMGFYKWE